ncbi:hypothetical protein [Streptomyces sp. 1222.5]|uniref:hypothetical protein n=1 Tax=Streptomyces sp. 1222.5 TaxID=1881026 RepID=UPI003D711666
MTSDLARSSASAAPSASKRRREQEGVRGMRARRDVNASGRDVGWIVMESGEDGAPTGRALTGLHEDLLTSDPSGREGADLWR